MLTASLQFLFLFLFIVPAILFLITQQNVLKSIHPENRFMSPGQVWLQLIPFFNLYWQFIVVGRIADSIKMELATTTFSFENESIPITDNQSLEPRPTYSIGIAYCVSFCLSIIPTVGFIGSLAGMICWVIYWVRLAQYKKEIGQKNYALVSPPSLP